VLNIYCEITTGLHVPAVCGGVTGDIIAKKRGNQSVKYQQNWLREYYSVGRAGEHTWL
jgi:sulfite exporter TauE/SafE